MKNFFKGIAVGIGGIAPGLSGSVLLVIFGLYHRVIECISTILHIKKLKSNLLFLLPIVLGIGIGLVGFSTVIDLALEHFEMQTRFLFLGLVIGTLPLLHEEVKKQGFSKKYYIHMAIAAVVGLTLFSLNGESFPQLSQPNFLQCILIGLAVAGSYILPGVDSAVILSTLGFYNVWVSVLHSFDFSLLIPIGIGGVIGVLVFSFVVNFLLKRFYTATFSVIFGMFVSIIPNVLKSENEIRVGFNGTTVASLLLCVFGVLFSFYFSDIQKHNKQLLRLLGKAPREESDGTEEAE